MTNATVTRLLQLTTPDGAAYAALVARLRGAEKQEAA